MDRGRRPRHRHTASRRVARWTRPQTEAFGGFVADRRLLCHRDHRPDQVDSVRDMARIGPRLGPQTRAAATARLQPRSILRHRSRSLLPAASLLAAADLRGRRRGNRTATRRSTNPATGNGGFTLVAQASRCSTWKSSTAAPAGCAGKLGRTRTTIWPWTRFAAEMRVSFRTKPGEDQLPQHLSNSVPTILGLPEATWRISKSKRFQFAEHLVRSGRSCWPAARRDSGLRGHEHPHVFPSQGVGDSIEARDANGSPVTWRWSGCSTPVSFGGAGDVRGELPEALSRLRLPRLPHPVPGGEGGRDFDAARVAAGATPGSMLSGSPSGWPISWQSRTPTSRHSRALGGLGLLMGTLGLAISSCSAMSSNAAERLALMRAIGIGNRRVGAIGPRRKSVPRCEWGPSQRKASKPAPQWARTSEAAGGRCPVGLAPGCSSPGSLRSAPIAALSAVGNAVRSPIISSRAGEPSKIGILVSRD